MYNTGTMTKYIYYLFKWDRRYKLQYFKVLLINLFSEERECVFTEDSDIINEDGSEDPSQIMYFCGHHKICNKFNNAKVTRFTKV